MFNNKKDKDRNFNFTDNEKKMKRRADILYGGMEDVKGELDTLVEPEKHLSKPAKENNTKKDTAKSPKVVKEEKDYNKIANMFYPTMKDKKVDNKEEKKDKPVTKRSLKDVGLEDDDYDVEDNKITPKDKREYEKINNVKYPKNAGNEKVDILKKLAKNNYDEIYKEENEHYVKGKIMLEKPGIDFVHNSSVKNYAKDNYGIEAAENLHMSKTESYMNTPYTKNHKVYNNYDDAPDNLKNYFKNKISEQIGDDKLDKTKGIYIDADSDSSKSLKNNLLEDADFITELKKYDKALNNNYFVNSSLQLKGKNWGNAVGKADIRDMHINKNGDLELYIADVYDFNVDGKSNLVRVGRDRQDKGKITPYFYAYRVIIPKEEKEKALKTIANERGKNE